MNPRITGWNPEGELSALLDALEADLLAAPDREVETWLHLLGETRPDLVEAVRRQVGAADAGSSLLAVPGPGTRGSGRPAHRPH